MFTIDRYLYGIERGKYWQVEKRTNNLFKAIAILLLNRGMYPHNRWRLSLDLR